MNLISRAISELFPKLLILKINKTKIKSGTWFNLWFLAYRLQGIQPPMGGFFQAPVEAYSLQLKQNGPCCLKMILPDSRKPLKNLWRSKVLPIETSLYLWRSKVPLPKSLKNLWRSKVKWQKPLKYLWPTRNDLRLGLPHQVILTTSISLTGLQINQEI